MTYVRNAWYVVAWEQDVPIDAPTAITILDEPVVLWRAGDRIVAFEDRCIHRLAPLSLGRCEGEKLRCMYHGLLYDSDGQVAQIPGQDMIPPQARLKTYPLVARHSWVWLWMGDPAQADPALIPPAVGFDDPDYILGRGFLDYRAEAQLINDNLLDFSHLSYVHANSFGAGPAFAEERPQLTPLDRGVRFERWIVDTIRPNGHQSQGPVDAWQSYDFLIPGILLMWSGSFAPGTAERCGYQRPDYRQAMGGVTFTSQAVTPTGDRTARYFFSWGPHRDHGDAAMRDQLMALADMAFAEDRTMIEAQQRVINSTPTPRIMPTVHDRGVTLYTRLVERLARAETEAAAVA